MVHYRDFFRVRYTYTVICYPFNGEGTTIPGAKLLSTEAEPLLESTGKVLNETWKSVLDPALYKELERERTSSSQLMYEITVHYYFTIIRGQLVHMW